MIAPDVGGGFGAKINPYRRGRARRRGWPGGSAARRGGSRPAARTWWRWATGVTTSTRSRIGGSRDGHVDAYRLDILANAGAYPPTAAFLPDLHPDDGAGHLRHRPRRDQRAGRRDEHDVGRGVPRRRSSRGHRRDRAGHRPVRRRDRHGPGRGAPPEPHRHDAVPVHDARAARPTTPATTRAPSTSRSRPPATTSCAPSRPVVAPPGDRPLLGHRRVDLRRDHRRWRPAPRVRGGRRRGRRHDRRPHRLVAPRPGPRHRVRHAGGRRLGSSRAHHGRRTATPHLVPRGEGTMGSRSLQPAAPRWSSPPNSWSTRRGELAADDLEADPADIVMDGGRFHVVGTPAIALDWADLAAAHPGELAVELDYKARGRHVPVRCARGRGRGRPRDRQGRRSRGSWPATTPARSSTRCWPRASARAASPRARPRRCSRSSSTTTTATRSTVDVRRLRGDLRRGAARASSW